MNESDWKPDARTLFWMSEKYEGFARAELSDGDLETAITFTQIAAIARAEALEMYEESM